MLNSLAEAILNTHIGKNNQHGDIKLNNILYSPWEKRYSETIEGFYSDFIKDRLPGYEIVMKWHKMLSEYSKMPGAVFPIRGGNTAGTLRRGWLVKVDEDFSYMFTDNDLAVYIYKMVLDGYCPAADEFYEYMTQFKPSSDIEWLKELQKSTGNKKEISNEKNSSGEERYFISMPVHFNRAGGKGDPDKTETEKNAYINTSPAPSCCLGAYGYKHAHILDVRGKYQINGQEIEWKKINKIELGEVKDYAWDSTIHNYVWKRTINDAAEKSELKNIVIAHFMRFLNPLNHFLAPMQGNNKYTKSNGDFSFDIAEYNHLQAYMFHKKAKMFGGEFADYIKMAMAPEIPVNERDDECIDIVYLEKSMAGKGDKGKGDKGKGDKGKEKTQKIPKVVLNPSNAEEFKRELINQKKAEITWIYADGSESIKAWNVARFDSTSNVFYNLYSKDEWRNRKKKKKALVEVQVRIIYTTGE